MIAFDSSLLSLEIVQLKSVSSAGGGSIGVIDQEQSTPDKEVIKRIGVPLAVARRFLIETNKFTRYINAVPVAVIRYGNLIVSLERHPLAVLGADYYNTLAAANPGGAAVSRSFDDWKPLSWLNLQTIISSINRSGNWYIDGRYAYRLQSSDVGLALRTATFLSSDGRFRRVPAQCFDLYNLNKPESVQMSDRTCMAYITDAGEGVLTPPIWKDIANLAKGKIAASIEGDSDDEDELDDGASVVKHDPFFDTINDTLAVNINFVLKAGDVIGKMFGYEFVEPLQLPRLMVEMHTVNLPNLPQELKKTYDTSIQFTHAMAWLLGMSRRVNDLDGAVMMRALMKYLSGKGTYMRKQFNHENIYLQGRSLDDVPTADIDQLNATFKERLRTEGIGNLLSAVRDRVETSKHTDQVHRMVGAMLTED